MESKVKAKPSMSYTVIRKKKSRPPWQRQLFWSLVVFIALCAFWWWMT